MKTITINNKTLDLSNAVLTIEDCNHVADDSHEWDATGVQAEVKLGKHIICYQTSGTLDAGGVSSELTINSESGAVDQLRDYLHGAGYIDDSASDEFIQSIAQSISDALGVQRSYESYMNNIGEWKRGDGMDASSQEFVKHESERG